MNLPKTLSVAQISLLSSAIFSSLLVLPPAAALAVDGVLEDSPKVVVDEAWQIVHEEYVDSNFNHVDWDATRHSLLRENYTSSEAAYAALRSALGSLNDPYTRFLDPREYAELSEQTAGEVSGIGVLLRRDEAASTIVVTEVVEGSPAEQAGVRPEDWLLFIDGQPTSRLTVSGASQRLRGEEGSQVILTISRGGAQQTLVIPRTRLEIPTVERALRQQGDSRIGYIRLIEFNAHAAEQMEQAIQDLLSQRVQGFVLDLRGNPGGLLQASIEISRMWLQRGAIVQTIDRDGNSESISANRSALTQLPLIVLVDDRSASSSEILTGALQDNRRATVVGDITFGKALVQSLHALSDGSGLTVTVAHYYTPNGTDISSKGITPDISVELSVSQRRELFNNPETLGTDADLQFVRAAQILAQTIAENTAQPINQLGRGNL